MTKKKDETKKREPKLKIETSFEELVDHALAYKKPKKAKKEEKKK